MEKYLDLLFEVDAEDGERREGQGLDLLLLLGMLPTKTSRLQVLASVEGGVWFAQQPALPLLRSFLSIAEFCSDTRCANNSNSNTQYIGLISRIVF